MEVSNLKSKIPNFVKSMDLTNDEVLKNGGTKNQTMNNRYSQGKKTKTIEF
jgi:hypothetical protein